MAEQHRTPWAYDPVRSVIYRADEDAPWFVAYVHHEVDAKGIVLAHNNYQSLVDALKNLRGAAFTFAPDWAEKSEVIEDAETALRNAGEWVP